MCQQPADDFNQSEASIASVRVKIYFKWVRKRKYHDCPTYLQLDLTALEKFAIWKSSDAAILRFRSIPLSESGSQLKPSLLQHVLHIPFGFCQQIVNVDATYHRTAFTCEAMFEADIMHSKA